MPDVAAEKSFNLAIETSSRRGSVTLGCGDEILRSQALPEQQGHLVGLVPVMDQVCREMGVKVWEIGQVYVSVGPGSFTGLRIGITTAKILGWVTGAKLVAVPTVDVVAWNVRGWPGEKKEGAVLAVCLNSKKGSVYGRLYGWGGQEWQGLEEMGLWRVEELMRRAMERGGGRVLVVGQALGELDGEGIEVLPTELSEPKSEGVWVMGRRLAAEGRYVEPGELLPIYARRPEAVELWDQKKRKEQGGVMGKMEG